MTIHVVFKNTGSNKISIYVQGKGVYNSCLDLMANVTGPINSSLGFPLAYDGFTIYHCKLLSPLKASLVVGTAENFKIHSKKCTGIMIADAANNQVNLTKDKDGNWIGPVTSTGGPVNVFASFDGPGGDMQGILQYS